MNTPEQQAFAQVLPTWALVRQEGKGAWFSKGELTIHLVTLSGLPRAVVFMKGKKPLYRGAVRFSNEEALLDVKSYLDRAFPGMS